MKKILLLDRVHPEFSAMLENQSFIVDFIEDADELKLKSIIKNYNGLVVRSKPLISAEILQYATNLKFVARAGSGIENIDYAYAKSKGIEVINSPEGNSNAVGEHALGLLLSLLKRITYSHNEVTEGKWEREKNRGNELAGKTVGIIGFGNTGSAFAKKLKSMDVEVLAYDKYKSNFGSDKVKECGLDEIKNKADVISFHVPQTNETINYADKCFFEEVSKPIILLNTSRGKIVNTVSLFEAIKSEKVISAGLDVIDLESYDFDMISIKEGGILQKLIETKKVIVTPHIAGITEESKYKHSVILFNKICSLENI